MSNSLAARLERTGGVVGSTLAMLAAVAHANPPAIYVDDDAPAGGDGQSWQTAFRDLQDAIAAAEVDVDEQREIRIAGGTYTPDQGTGARWMSFSLASSAPMVLGGFAGLGSADPDARDPARFVTTLSGDLNGDDLPGFGNRQDNSLTVLVIQLYTEQTRTLLLDGITIRGGYNDQYYSEGGGGVWMNATFNAQIVLRNCRITDNFAWRRGGGGLSYAQYLNIEDSILDGNVAWESGGGLATRGGNRVDLTRCIFANNEGGSASALTTSAYTVSLSDSLLTNNVASVGSTMEFGRGLISVTGCTLADNHTSDGATIEATGATVRINGTIVRHPPGAPSAQRALGLDYSTADVNSSDVEGGLDAVRLVQTTLDWGADNIDADPRWASPAGADGIRETWEDNDYSLRADSPCIDRGPGWRWDAAPHDLIGNQRVSSSGCPCSSRADMGAFEYQYVCDATPIPVVYVNGTAAEGGDGRSWSAAFRTLDEALALPGASEIWVAAGTYVPGGDAPGNGSTYWMRCDVRIFGGFAGNEVSREARNPAANPTVLSGDVLGNDGADPESRLDNVRSIVSIQGGHVMLDGFLISGAWSTQESAVRAAHAGLTLRGCVLTGNHLSPRRQTQSYVGGSALRTLDCDVLLDGALFEGNRTEREYYGSGSAAQIEGGTARLNECRFIDNIAVGESEIYGGGLWIDVHDAELRECDFVGNQVIVLSERQYGYASAGGGGLIGSGDGLSLVNCSFIGNETSASSHSSGNASAWSAAWSISGDSVRIINCLVIGNGTQSTRRVGQSAANIYGPSPLVMNCTFAYNTGDGPQANSGSIWFSDPAAQVVNCIFYENRMGVRRDAVAQIDYIGGALVTPVNSCIQGWTEGLPGVNVILTNPLFLDPLGADGIAGTGDEDYTIGAGSPCVDAGETGLLPADVFDLDGDFDVTEALPVDLRGQARVRGTGVDMGAIESGEVACRADIAVDGRVDTRDFFQYLAWFFEQEARADFDHNGTVDSADFFSFFQVWSMGC